MLILIIKRCTTYAQNQQMQKDHYGKISVSKEIDRPKWWYFITKKRIGSVQISYMDSSDAHSM